MSKAVLCGDSRLRLPGEAKRAEPIRLTSLAIARSSLNTTATCRKEPSYHCWGRLGLRARNWSTSWV